jgi:hypothetical protein
MLKKPDISFATRVSNKLFPKRAARIKEMQEFGRKHAKEQVARELAKLYAESSRGSL